MTQTNWSNLVLRLTATNTTMTAISNVGSDPQRVYRVGDRFWACPGGGG
ncbi:MAG: hypothetical protein ABI680_09540 [Chthoniobacteraceae bacterium]